MRLAYVRLFSFCDSQTHTVSAPSHSLSFLNAINLLVLKEPLLSLQESRRVQVVQVVHSAASRSIVAQHGDSKFHRVRPYV